MEPRISKRKARSALRLLYPVAALLLIGVISLNIIVMVVALALTFYAAYRVDAVSKCPHCGAGFRGLNPARPDAGHCRSCGRLMEFDDAA